MENIYHVQKIQSNILLITESGFREFSNIFVFGDKPSCLIIDTGVGLRNLKKFLKKMGYRRFIVTLTHTHYDHFGGLKDFEPDEIYLTREIAKNLNNKKLWGLEFLKIKDFPRKKDYFSIKDQFKNWPKESYSNYLSNRISLNKKFSFKIIKTPGHTDDSIIFWDSKNGIIVTGDSFYQGKPYFNCRNSDKLKLKNVLVKIAKLDFQLALTGHNEILTKKLANKNINLWLDGLNF